MYLWWAAGTYIIGLVRQQVQALSTVQCLGRPTFSILRRIFNLKRNDTSPSPDAGQRCHTVVQIQMRLAHLPLPLLFVLGTYASSGDRADDYQYCLSKEMEFRCSKAQDFPLAMRLTRWTCEDDVKYTCMHSTVDKSIEKGEQVQQYYGKWPFWRLLGMQEPASVLFSALNFWAHWREGKKLRRRISREHPMRPYYIGFNILSLNMWVWSAVFHTRGPSLISYDHVIPN